MEQLILTASAVAAAFNLAEQGKELAKATRDAVKSDSDNAVSAFKALVADHMAGKPDFMLPSIVGAVCASVEAEFSGAQPGTYRTMKNAIVPYVREGFTDLTIGRDAMRKAAKAAEEARIHGAEKARQAQVDAYIAEQEAAERAARDALWDAVEAEEAAEREAAAAAELARVAVLWRKLQETCTSKAAKAAFGELTAALAINL